MPDYTVIQRGIDSSGRRLYATRYMWAWWDALCERLGFAPVITQGAFMTLNGGGAAESAGFHDRAGTFDLRVWNLTAEQVDAVIREARATGAAAYLRNEEHGGFTDDHIHLVLGSDRPLSAGAADQWLDYINGRDGLSSNGPDYHPRPDPLVLTWEADDMFSDEDRAKLEDTLTAVRELAAEERVRAKATKDRDRRLAHDIRGAIKTGRLEVLEAIAAELDNE